MRKAQRVVTLAAATAALAGLTMVGTASAAPLATASRIVAGGNYTGVIANGLTVTFECHAAAPGAVSTAIDSCYLTTGGAAAPIALPGDAAATAGVSTVPFAPFRLCWSASATFVDASRNSTSGCTLLPSVAGVPSLAGTGVSAA